MKKRAAVFTRLSAFILVCLLLSGCTRLPVYYAKSVINTYSIYDEFSNISVVCPDCEVELLPSKTESNRKVTATIVCRETDEAEHVVTVEDGTLKITHKTNTRFGINLNKNIYHELAVYLPAEQYQSLSVRTGSGAIYLPDDIGFENVSLLTSSGLIESEAKVQRTLLAQSGSGIQHLKGTSPEYLEAYSTSGNIVIDNSAGSSAWVESTSGDITLRQVVFREELNIFSESGEVRMNMCDAPLIVIYTTSGNITGTVLSPKIFDISSESGDMSFPLVQESQITDSDHENAEIGTCEMHSVSGSIDIKLKN